MVGALAKTYYADKMGLDPAKIRVISIMPCTAKKWEIVRSEDMSSSGFQDVDVSLTTRELARMIKQAGIDFRSLPDEAADNPLGEYSGAGTIFGATGGVMTAALRTAYFYITGTELGELNFRAIEGLAGIKEFLVALSECVGLLLDGGGLVADVSGLKQQLFSQLLVRSFFCHRISPAFLFSYTCYLSKTRRFWPVGSSSLVEIQPP